MLAAMRHIQCQDMDAAGFARFGEVIDAAGSAPELINDGTTRRFPDLAEFEIGDGRVRPVIGMYLANARGFPLRIAALERHRQASQAFIPLGLHRLVMVVAPGDESPEWAGLRAFVTRPGQGVSLSRGTWHHGLVALGDGDRFAVIEGGNYRGDTVLSSAPTELWLCAPVE